MPHTPRYDGKRQQRCLNCHAFQLKGHWLFPVRSSMTLSVPDKLGMMVALCLLEPTETLMLLPQSCQTSFLWLPAEQKKRVSCFKRTLQVFSKAGVFAGSPALAQALKKTKKSWKSLDKEVQFVTNKWKSVITFHICRGIYILATFRCGAYVPLLMVGCGCLYAPSHQAPKHTSVGKEV